MDTSRARIFQFIESQGISPKFFLEKTGLKKGFIDRSHVNSSASDIYLSKILEVFPELSAEWLLTGRGNMLKEVVDSKGINSNIKDSFNNIKDFNAKIYNKSTVGKEEIPDIKDQLLEKDKQLAEKDKQINNLLDRLTESQTQVTTLLEQQSKLIGKL